MLKDSPVCGEVVPLSGVTVVSVLFFSGLTTRASGKRRRRQGKHENEFWNFDLVNITVVARGQRRQ